MNVALFKPLGGCNGGLAGGRKGKVGLGFLKGKGHKVDEFRPFSLKSPLVGQDEGWELGAGPSKMGLEVDGPLEALAHPAFAIEARAQEES